MAARLPGDWVELPGPAEWWERQGLTVAQNDALIDKWGFDFSEAESGHEEAWNLVHAAQEPNDNSWEYIFPATGDLFMMPRTSMSEEFIRLFSGSLGR